MPDVTDLIDRAARAYGFSGAIGVHRAPALWTALFDGRIVSRATVAEMVTPRTRCTPPDSYGRGFWVRAKTGVVVLGGYDAGVSFRSLHDPRRALTLTVVSNTSEGAWPVLDVLERELDL